jgi:sugar-specific transcriptional regulator TrmB
MSLSKALSSIGLDEKSQKVYLAILKLSDAPASIIAKKAGLPRTTTYHHLENLVEMGLASKYKHQKIIRFAAENADSLKGVIEGKLALLEKYLPELKKLSSTERIIKLRLFEGAKGVQQIAQEELECQEKIVRSIGSHHDLRKAANGKITFASRRIEKKIFSKCLRPSDDNFKNGWLENQQKELREVKLLPNGINVPGMIFIYDDKVAIITPEEEGLGFIINSKTFSQSLKNIFDALWLVSTKTI